MRKELNYYNEFSKKSQLLFLLSSFVVRNENIWKGLSVIWYSETFQKSSPESPELSDDFREVSMLIWNKIHQNVWIRLTIMTNWWG